MFRGPRPLLVFNLSAPIDASEFGPRLRTTLTVGRVSPCSLRVLLQQDARSTTGHQRFSTGQSGERLIIDRLSNVRDDVETLAPAALIALDVFTRADLLAAGFTDRYTRDGVREGRIRRLGRGLYTTGERPMLRVNQLLERARALAIHYPGRVAISHHAALALHGIAVHEVPLDLVYAVRLMGGIHSKSGLVICRPRTPPPTLEVDAVTVVQPAVAVIQVAATFGLRAGVVAADSARHRGRLELEDLREELERAGRIPGIGTARLAVQRSAAGAESPGESLLRLVAEDVGFEVTTQFPISERLGRPFAYADLRLVGTNCLLEFDGSVKYEGANGRKSLVAEKSREDRIRRLGWEMDRVVWKDFENIRALRRRLGARLP